MSSFNHVSLLGNIAADPELRYTSGGTPVANFSLATNERGPVDKVTGERKQNTNFHKIVCWGKLGETCAEYLSKGRQVLVEGRIQYRSYTDKEGIMRKVAEIIAKNVQFLGGPKKVENEPAAAEDLASDDAPESSTVPESPAEEIK
jgi:single-strand DNA-binding protein